MSQQLYPPLLDGVAWLDRRHNADRWEHIVEPLRRIAARVAEEDLYD